MTNEEMKEFVGYVKKVDEIMSLLGDDYGDDFDKYLNTIAMFLATLVRQGFLNKDIFMTFPQRIWTYLDKIIEIERVVNDKPSK